MYEQSLIQAGLSYTQATVYEALIKNGSMPAGKLTKKTPFKRGLVYLALEDLVKLDLVEKDEKDHRAAIFQVKHPLQLRNLAEKREQQAKDAKLALEGMISSIVSDYNLVSGRPGVLFYEGLEGVKKVINDTLSSKGIIYTYADVEAIDKYIKKFNEEYAKKRDKLHLVKKGLVVDSLFSREYLKSYHKETTDIKFIPINHFGTIMEIYENKVSYVSMSDSKMIGVIIEDKNIFEMHKTLFEFNWENAKTFDQLAPFSKAQ
jgi:HTH-type transcriptional regulator, sugar sensing transcriptional regulator